MLHRRPLIPTGGKTPRVYLGVFSLQILCDVWTVGLSDGQAERETFVARKRFVWVENLPKPSIIFHEIENDVDRREKEQNKVGATLATHHSGIGTTKQLSAGKIQRRER